MGLISSVGNAVNNVVETAGEAVDDVVEAGAEAVGADDVSFGAIENLGEDVFEAVDGGVESMFGDVDFNTDTLEDVGSALLEGGKDVISGDKSLGGAVGGAVDAVGLPDWAGDFTAMTVDFATGNAIAGTDHATSLLGETAEAAGADGVAGFLDTAGEVTGMFNDVSMKVGTTAVKAQLTGGMGGEGMLSQLGQAGELGKLGDIAGKAGDLGETLETATDVVGAFDDGDHLEAGTGVFDVLGGNVGDVGDLLGDSLDPGTTKAMQSALGGGGDLLGEIFGEFGGAGGLSDLPVGEILGQAGAASGDLNGLAGPVSELAGELAGATGGAAGLGSELLGSPAGQQLLDGLVAVAGQQGAEGLEGLDATIESLVHEAGSTTAGFVDMAGHDAEVAADVASLLGQIGSMTSSTSVSQMVGAQMRA